MTGRENIHQNFLQSFEIQVSTHYHSVISVPFAVPVRYLSLYEEGILFLRKYTRDEIQSGEVSLGSSRMLCTVRRLKMANEG